MFQYKKASTKIKIEIIKVGISAYIVKVRRNSSFKWFTFLFMRSTPGVVTSIFYYKLISLLPDILKNKSKATTVVSVSMVDNAAAVP